MDEGRVGAVRRMQDQHRKNTILMNDIITFQQNVYACYLNRERQSVEAKLKAEEVYLKRSIVRNNILQQCMESRKQNLAQKRPDKLILGQYGGVPLNAFAKDIDARIAWMHPRLRRLRKVDKLKQKAVKLGAIIDSTTIQDKIETIFSKPPTNESSDPIEKSENSKKRNKQRRKSSIFNKGTKSSTSYVNRMLLRNPFTASLSTQVQTQHKEHDNQEGPENTKTDIAKSESGTKENTTRRSGKGNDSKNVSDADGESTDNDKTAKAPPPLVRRPTLILSPIQTTKEMKMRGFDGLGGKGDSKSTY